MKVLLIVCVVFVGAAVAQREASACEKHRQRLTERPLLGALMPKCEENGDYAALQCHHDRFCQCFTRDGSPLTKPSGTIKSCDCIREREEKKSGPNGEVMIGAFVPTCREDGYFHSRQCWGSVGMCWCADKLGNKLTEPSRGAGLNC